VVRRIYEHLDIHDFEEFEPSLKQYVGSVSGYRKNEFPELPTGLREKISHAWERSFEEWGYPRS
jgi:omega-hydroxy-beta-dihydromenaquinone-9 sulfotransferase